MRIIIFSKNRAAQAELLLRSLKEMVIGWENFLVTIFYNYDAEIYEQGYAVLKKIHPEFHYHKEDPARSLNSQLNELITLKEKEFFSFFVDDMVVVRPFSKKDGQFKLLAQRSDILALSLRLNKNINYCQPRGWKGHPLKIDQSGVYSLKRSKFQHFLERNILSRALRKIGFGVFVPVWGDWSIKMSMDGNVFRFNEFKEYFKKLPECSYVPALEPLMGRTPMDGDNMIIYPESRIMNIASNKIGRINMHYKSAEEDPAFINNKFLSGGRLSYEHLKNINNRSCHICQELIWK